MTRFLYVRYPIFPCLGSPWPHIETTERSSCHLMCDLVMRVINEFWEHKLDSPLKVSRAPTQGIISRCQEVSGPSLISWRFGEKNSWTLFSISPHLASKFLNTSTFHFFKSVFITSSFLVNLYPSQPWKSLLFHQFANSFLKFLCYNHTFSNLKRSRTPNTIWSV